MLNFVLHSASRARYGACGWDADIYIIAFTERLSLTAANLDN